MPNTCTFDIGLNGLEPDAVGLPTRLQAYARVQGACTRVRLTVRDPQSGLPLFSDEANADTNGTVAVSFPLNFPIFPCGHQLRVEAECVSGGSCSGSALVAIACKTRPNGGSDPNDPNAPGGGGGGGQPNDDWPWGLPPVLWCPLMGRRFTEALLLAAATILIGIAFAIPAVTAAGGVIAAGAFAILAVWRTWCNVSYCKFRGALLWVMKRATLMAIVLSLVTASALMLMVAIACGVVAGMLTAQLRANRCALPDVTTPLNQLPLW